MKKLLALMMSILMVFSMATLLSSCGKSDDTDNTKSSASSENEAGKKGKKSSKSDEELIVGDWEMKIDFAKILAASSDETGLPADFKLDDSDVTLLWNFANDGTFTMDLDQDSFNKVMDSFIDVIVGQFTDDPAQQAAFKEEALAGMEEEAGFETQNGKYQFKNGKLYTTEEDEENIYTYKFISDDEIQITDIEIKGEDDSAIDLSTALPLTLTRK